MVLYISGIKARRLSSLCCIVLTAFPHIPRSRTAPLLPRYPPILCMKSTTVGTISTKISVESMSIISFFWQSLTNTAVALCGLLPSSTPILTMLAIASQSWFSAIAMKNARILPEGPVANSATWFHSRPLRTIGRLPKLVCWGRIPTSTHRLRGTKEWLVTSTEDEKNPSCILFGRKSSFDLWVVDQ